MRKDFCSGGAEGAIAGTTAQGITQFLTAQTRLAIRKLIQVIQAIGGRIIQATTKSTGEVGCCIGSPANCSGQT